jgi:two-component system LytT family response regulator
MYTAIIIDDELNARKFLFNLIGQHFAAQIHVIEMASNVKEAVKMIKTYNPDLVFLDIEMPDESGFSIYNHLGEQYHQDVIITTAHKEYALAAIKKGAFDYLLKPIDKIHLMSLLKKLDKKKFTNIHLNLAQNYSENLPKLSFTTHYGVKFLELYSIVYANAAGSYTEIHTTEGKVITVTKSLKEFEDSRQATVFFVATSLM